MFKHVYAFDICHKHRKFSSNFLVAYFMRFLLQYKNSVKLYMQLKYYYFESYGFVDFVNIYNFSTYFSKKILILRYTV